MLIVAAVFTIVTSVTATTAPIAIAGTGVCPENPSPPEPANPSMVLHVPAEGATVTSPVTVTGLARVFEANVRITIYNASGAILTDTFTTAAQAGPVLAPFSAAVPFSVSATQKGCVRVWEESAQDGSPRNVVQHEVTLSTGAIAPPSTGDAGLAVP
jgi:hypothetical protein